MPIPGTTGQLVARHLRYGWWSLLVFLSLGIVLEGLHGFKIGWYLNVANESRRLMFTLAHAHGTLLALVNVAFAFTLQHGGAGRFSARASVSLILASFLLPGGFLLGGLAVYQGDPSPGILLVPLGALLLLIAVLLTALSLGSSAAGPVATAAADLDDHAKAEPAARAVRRGSRTK